MEGVGGRFGRSSSRYGGAATVFTGPVRKWKKKWSPVTVSNNNKHPPHNTNGNTSSCLLLYKWTPYDINIHDSNLTIPNLPTRRFKYIPTAVLEEEKNESAEEDDESNSDDTKPEAAELDEKPDAPEKENKDIKDNPPERQDLNESTLDLSLG